MSEIWDIGLRIWRFGVGETKSLEFSCFEVLGVGLVSGVWDLRFEAGVGLVKGLQQLPWGR